ncbi:MAG: acetamidase/formamidase family protein [Planctomycetota bacterium]
MQPITTSVLYYLASSENPVTHQIQLGEEFEAMMQMNAGPWIDRLTPEEQADWNRKITGPNPSSGCVFVKGVGPGDVLSIEFGPIQLEPIGYTKFGGNNGAMPGLLDIGPQQKVVQIKDGLIHWSESIRIPVKPMLGFVAVAPAWIESYPNTWGGYWGGNLDAQEVTTGTTLHLRVHHPGALLSVGDMHAIQGDGEICGSGGIETGGRVRLRCKLNHGPSRRQQWPRFENQTHIGAIATGVPAQHAFHLALTELLNWLNEAYKLPLGEAYMLLG